MTKKIFMKLGMLFLIILAAAGIAAGYKFLSGIYIRHYAQFIFPCQGRIVTLVDHEATISFNVLDECKISELSDKQNIRGIEFITQKGDTILAKDWNVSEAGFYQGNKFSAKKISITALFKEQAIIQKLKLVYPDKTEVFDIDSLTIDPIIITNEAAYAQINSSPMGFNPGNVPINADSDTQLSSVSMLHLYISMLGKDYIIQHIDLGIPGMGVDPATAKFIPANTDFGVSFTNDPANRVYLENEIIAVLPDQKVNIELNNTGDKLVELIIAVRKTKEYTDKPVSTYLSPLFTCMDTSTNTQYVYGNFDYYIDSPFIISDKSAGKLLKEFGQ